MPQYPVQELKLSCSKLELCSIITRMDNSINPYKNMKNRIILLVSCLLISNLLYAQNCLLSIRFSGLFNKNKVSFYIINKAIFENVTLNHNLSTGDSDISLLFVKKTENIFYVANTFSKANHFIQPYLKLNEDWGGILNCKLVIDKREYLFIIDTKKGNYMGFYYNPYEKNKDNIISFVQAFKHFED